MEGAEPQGTLECPQDYILDEKLNMCVPENPATQASLESAAPFKPNAKIERCIQNVKQQLLKKQSGMDAKVVKSTAIAICRARLKQ